MTAIEHIPHEPSSVWGEFFSPCAPQCADQCCGDLDHEAQTNDDDLLQVYAFDDEHVSFNGDSDHMLPPMKQPAAADRMKAQRTDPWACLNSGPGDSFGQVGSSFGQVGRGFPSQASYGALSAGKAQTLGFKGVAMAPRPRRAPSPSVNPMSKFGFMTMTVPGSEYSADPQDVMDVQMARELKALDPEATSALMIRRLTRGKYEIDGRFVSVQWSSGPGSELLAKEDVGGEEELPVAEYLEQLAGLAREIRPPVAPRALTFPDEALEDRYESMQLACEQAKLREKAAEACWQGGSSFVPPTLMASKAPGFPALRAVSSTSSMGGMPTFLRRLH